MNIFLKYTKQENRALNILESSTGHLSKLCLNCTDQEPQLTTGDVYFSVYNLDFQHPNLFCDRGPHVNPTACLPSTK
jgi:hypothetical protein